VAASKKGKPTAAASELGKPSSGVSTAVWVAIIGTLGTVGAAVITAIVTLNGQSVLPPSPAATPSPASSSAGPITDDSDLLGSATVTSIAIYRTQKVGREHKYTFGGRLKLPYGRGLYSVVVVARPLNGDPNNEENWRISPEARVGPDGTWRIEWATPRALDEYSCSAVVLSGTLARDFIR
jgi:hypothetical protein